MIELLDQILLSNNVVEYFNKNYHNDKFKNWLLGIIPEIEDCKNTKQDNPWHIYDCFDHILHSVEAINRLSNSFDKKTRRILAYTMLLHDIGKPQCKVRRYSKFYGREVDSFFDHNLVSKKIAERVLNKFGFESKEVEIIKSLVEYHDIFMFITLENDGNKFHHVLNQSLVNDYVQKFNIFGDGKKILYYLTLVGLADNMSQNPEMTAKSMETIKKMQEIIFSN